ncbi:hypothetical protein bcgnr5379_62230 [Bacillus cereus]
MTLKSLDPRLRGDDDLQQTRRNLPTVMPANAGIQGFTAVRPRSQAANAFSMSAAIDSGLSVGA